MLWFILIIAGLLWLFFGSGAAKGWLKLCIIVFILMVLAVVFLVVAA